MATCSSRWGRWLPAIPVVALAAALGCAGRPWVNPPAEILDRTWYNARPLPDSYPDPHATTVAGLDAAFGGGPPQPVAEGRPLEVLAISGGGKFGAFCAGVLSGWTANGTRPPFDVVTGISSGALLAAYAFAGPEYDGRMAENFRNVRSRDLYRFRPLGPFTMGALTTTGPFQRLIEREVDEAMLCRIREAHCAGRRLFVATGNRTTFRPAIWDVGAIATSGRPDADDLVRKVLLAAVSHPGATPAVEFDVLVNGARYRELHGDGGNLIQAFVWTGNGLPPGSNVYLVTAGKWQRDPRDTRPGVISSATDAASATLYALYRADVMNVYSLCAVNRAQFHLVNMPAGLHVSPGSFRFDPEEQRRMFDTGYSMAAGGVPWRLTPPGTQPGETTQPRAGLQFVVQ